ncbi:M-phase inducer phosphatase isoform X2 [Teleopsis dalmanni]|uniref:M-phase inducer phosphatase isoform X2 n=1 Tax=Teleopsis dalmanni TaxID=139649 RepID=UPI0018CCAEF0|nr:M-phase inducer phosphatase isoform X2 [Teleopsis dalmanni]
MPTPKKRPKNESSDNYQMSARKARLGNDHPSGLLNMVVDELSFYGDESQSELHQEHPYVPSPPLLGLLSPEGSPQRFCIFENADVSAPENKFQQNLQNQATSTSSSNLSAKSFRIFNSLSSCSMESSVDDDYMDLFEMETLEQPHQSGHSSICFPSDLTSLISGHIKSSSPAKIEAITPEMHRPSVRRCLSMTENYQQNQPKTPELLKKAQETPTSTTPFASRLTVERTQTNSTTPVSANCFKRPEPPSSVNCSPVQNKRYRSVEKENFDNLLTVTNTMTSSTLTQITYPTSLRKCISMNDAEILSALTRSESQDGPDLIGDFSKPFVLPLLDGRHRDLKSVSSDTLARLINGEFSNEIASYKIIDCRYPYEFEGGHIRGAQNLYTQEQIHEEFLTQQKTEQNQENVQAAGARRNIIIFHCEFSSERGPKLSRFLRNHDRTRNTNSYPMLDYPEIYLLHNGYKEFYETHAELCDPSSYRPMLEPAYSEAYRQFRSKSKSWNGDGINGTSRLKKSRSRLLL